MDATTYQAQFPEGVEVRLALFSYIEEDVHVVYAPALDLYGYGNDEFEARASFSVALEEYVAYTTTQHTLDTDLRRLGWAINSQSHTVTMPAWTSLLTMNPQLDELMSNRPFKKFDQVARIPAFV